MTMGVIKEKIAAIVEKDATLKSSLEELAANKPKLKDLLNSEKLKAIIKKLAMIAIALRDKFCTDPGMTVDQLIDKIGEYLDEKISLPWYLESFDWMLFVWLMKYTMHLIETAAENSQLVAFYAQALDEGTALA